MRELERRENWCNCMKNKREGGRGKNFVGNTMTRILLHVRT